MNQTSSYPTFHPIKVFVSHEWQKDTAGTVSVRQDARWKALRFLIKGIADEVKKRNESTPGRHKLAINIQRLRARHGQFILTALNQRIQMADILVMDLGSDTSDQYNNNVLIELGIAIGMGKLEKQGLFILKPKDLCMPSDLSGLLYTDYISTEDEKIKVVDRIGFRAAMRSTITYIAEQRNMIGEPSESVVDFEETYDDADPER